MERTVTRRYWIIALLVFASGCNGGWPKDTLDKPNFASASTVHLPPYGRYAYAVDSEVKLPSWAKVNKRNDIVGPNGAVVTAMLSRPWPTEEDSMVPVLNKLKKGKTFDKGDKHVVARPWIGSLEERPALSRYEVDRYLMMTDELFLDIIVRRPPNSKEALEEGHELARHVIYSIKRVPKPRQAVANRSTNASQPPDSIDARASASSR